MNLILMIIISIVVCFAYDFFKSKLIKSRLETMEEDKLFSMFDDYFK